MDGKEWVGWTTGETQAARYDLSKSIDELIYDSDNKRLIARNKGFTVMHESGVEPGNVKDFVGKEPAEKLLQSPNKFGVQFIEGENLKIGGEGMKAFYDKILPNEVAKYVKQWGGTVEKARIGQPKKHSGKLTKEELSEARRDAKALVRGDIDTDEFNATWDTKLDSDDIPGRDPYRFNESVQEIVNLVRKTRELDAGGLVS